MVGTEGKPDSKNQVPDVHCTAPQPSNSGRACEIPERDKGKDGIGREKVNTSQCEA